MKRGFLAGSQGGERSGEVKKEEEDCGQTRL